jgi:hypothetical protein
VANGKLANKRCRRLSIEQGLIGVGIGEELGMLLARRSLSFIGLRTSLSNARPPFIAAIARRHYAATAPGPEPKLHPLSGPIPGELDARFGDLPPWTVPVVNRNNLTETPVVPYDDKQARRYYGEPVFPNTQAY